MLRLACSPAPASALSSFMKSRSHVSASDPRTSIDGVPGLWTARMIAWAARAGSAGVLGEVCLAAGAHGAGVVADLLPRLGEGALVISHLIRGMVASRESPGPGAGDRGLGSLPRCG